MRFYAAIATVVTILVVACILGQPAAAADSASEQFIVQPDQSIPAPEAPELPPGCGFLPPPFATDHLPPPSVMAKASQKAFPLRVDWREQGKVTPIRNQGACGACYTFGAAGNFESRLLMADLGAADLSENNLKECHYQASSCDGGNQHMVMSYLTRQGSVLESCDPYVASDVACNSSCDLQHTVLEWRALSGDTVPAVDVIKQYLTDYGPLHVAMYAGDDQDPAWQTTFGTYNGSGGLYYTGSYSPNHSVMIVGWDDDQSHTGGGSGCWIARNSWGTSWGGNCDYGAESGYFYIAYGSASMGTWASTVSDFMLYDAEVEVLSYDEAGYTASVGGGSTTLWGMARFTMPRAAFVHRVELWTNDATTDLDVYVYDTFSGGVLSGLIDSRLNSSFAEAGYYSIALDSPLELASGTTIYVAVRIQNETSTMPVTVDTQGPTESATTFISVDGNAWTDLALYNCDATLRLRTDQDAVLALDDGEEERWIQPDDETPRQYQLHDAYPNPFNPSTTIAYSLPYAGQVRLTIHDARGRQLRTLVSGVQPAGYRQATWDGRDDAGRGVPGGIYFYRIEAGDYMAAKKLVLLK